MSNKLVKIKTNGGYDSRVYHCGQIDFDSNNEAFIDEAFVDDLLKVDDRLSLVVEEQKPIISTDIPVAFIKTETPIQDIKIENDKDLLINEEDKNIESIDEKDEYKKELTNMSVADLKKMAIEDLGLKDKIKGLNKSELVNIILANI
jgi:hypothetical protein